MGGPADARAGGIDFPIVESDLTGMLAIDLDGNVLQANSAAAAILGLPMSEVIGLNGLTLLSGAERERAAAKLQSAKNDASVLGRELYHYVNPLGIEHWIEVDTTVLHGADGEPGYAIAMFRDATAQVQIESALASYSASLTHLVDHAPVAIVSLTGEGIVESWNPAASDMFGWSAEEVIGTPIPILPDEVRATLGSSLERLRGGKPITSRPIAAVHKDGHTVHIVCSAVARIDAEGATESIVAYGIDVTDRVHAEEELRANDQRFRRMVDNLREVVAIIEPSGNVLASTVFAGSDAGTSGGVAPTRIGFDDIIGLMHPDDHEAAVEFLRQLSETPGGEQRALFRVIDPRRGWAWIETTAVNHVNDPTIGGIVLTAHDVSPHKQNELLLADHASVLELIARNAPLDEVLDAIVAMVGEHTSDATSAILLVVDDGSIELGAGDLTDEMAEALVQPGALERFGVIRKALETHDPVIVKDLANDPLCVDSRELLTRCGMQASWCVPILRSHDSEPLGVFATWFTTSRGPRSHERRVAAAAAHLADIAIERSHSQHDLARAAHFDQLTGLPNRRHLLDHLATALGRAEHNGNNVAVMFLDLDRFKLVNDSFGHTVGDELMRLFAARLRTLLRPGDLVGRFEGDEFVIVLDDIIDELDVRSITNRFEFALSQPFPIEGGEVVLTASTGIAISGGGETPTDLLQNADVALVRAKERGRDTIEMFDDTLRTRARVRLDTERDLRVAIERGELAVFYQPKIDLRSGTIFGAEALLRWYHPTQGLVGPASFIPVAEETGLITRIGKWVLDESLHQARTWLDRGNGGIPMTLSVNLSARQLRAPDLVTDVEQSLVRHGWDPKHLILELTESLLIDDTDGTIQRLRELKDLGVRLAIDDFGTGYSSLSYLDQLPVDVVKIDRAFVSRVQADGTGAAIVTAVLHMGAALGLTVLGEGVEEQHQLDGLRKLGCQWAQGYHFARPMPAQEMTDLLETSPTW